MDLPDTLPLVLVLVLAAIAIVTTVLPLSRAKAWWVRVWDFPRLQIAVVGLVALAALPWVVSLRSSGWLTLAIVLAASVAYQLLIVWRWTRLAPFEVKTAEGADPLRHVTLMVSNVLQTNRDAGRLLGVVRGADPDLVLCVETDDWWRQRLDALLATHPHAVQCPLGNTYGMLLYSRLPLESHSVDFLIEPDVPSIQARVRLRTGATLWLNCVHPRPPAPETGDSEERDAELLTIGKRVRDARVPVIVCGDLNDVAWSRTTRRFQQVSRLLDPRKGRGMFSTFHAKYPGLRYPLDHIFHSADMRLVTIRRLKGVGSDHFPVFVKLEV